MRRRDENSTPSSPDDPGGPLPDNAFTPELFAELDQREHVPAVPEGELPGPWRVTRLWGDGPPLFAVYGLGERGPRVTFDDTGCFSGEGACRGPVDLAHLTAAALARAQFLAAVPAAVLERAGAILLDEPRRLRRDPTAGPVPGLPARRTNEKGPGGLHPPGPFASPPLRAGRATLQFTSSP